MEYPFEVVKKAHPDKRIVGVRKVGTATCPYCGYESKLFQFLLHDPRTGELEEDIRNENGWAYACPFCGCM